MSKIIGLTLEQLVKKAKHKSHKQKSKITDCSILDLITLLNGGAVPVYLNHPGVRNPVVYHLVDYKGYDFGAKTKTVVFSLRRYCRELNFEELNQHADCKPRYEPKYKR